MFARPAAADGQLPRVTFFRPDVAKNTFVYCLFARRSGSPIALEFGLLFNSLWFFRSAQFMFPFVLGEINLDRRSTAFVSDTSQWSRACCMLGILTADLLRELTVHKFNFVHESSRFSCVLPNIYGSSRRCLGFLLDVDNPSPSFTTCFNRRHRRESTNEVHGVRIAPVNFLRRLFVSALDFDWSIYKFELKLMLTLVSFICT